jgi:hypothetical protein
MQPRHPDITVMLIGHAGNGGANFQNDAALAYLAAAWVGGFDSA